MSDFYIFPKPRRRVPQALGLLGTLCLLGLVPVGTAQAACDSESPVYCIDGTVPNDGETLYQDKYGNVKELGPLNSNTTKVGVINTDALPTLGLTNPNAQVDLRNVWIDSAKDPTTKDIWLYFGWERDSTSGSGFISLEAQQAKPPAACDYTKSDADLIASCNPWAGRQAKDFLILWDQSGSSTAIILRYFNGTSFDAGITLPAELAVATYSPDGSRGELALNLTQAVFKGQACTSIANILPGTVTGNSDTADYKDWVPLTAPTISSCATVTVKKVTNPTGSTQDFSFTPALTLIPANPGADPFTLNDSGTKSWINVAEGTGYTVTEGSPSPYELTSITCTKNGDPFNGDDDTTDVANRTATFDVEAGDKVYCTFTNTGSGTIIVKKNTSAAQRGGTFVFTSNTGLGTSLTTSSGNDYIASTTFSGKLAGTYDVAETVPAGWNLTSSSCDDESLPGAIGLDAGETVTCTFVDAPKLGAIEITKRVKVPGADSMQGQSRVKFTISGGSLGSPGTEVTTGTNGKACYGGLVVSAMSGIGNYTVTETVPPGYANQIPEQTVAVTEGTCESGANTVTFTNTPLTDITVKAEAQVLGATKSTISCVNSIAQSIGSVALADPANLSVLNLVPGTYTCTIVIDP